jgi:integrase
MPRQRRDIPWVDQRGDAWYVFWYNADKQRTERLSLRTTDRMEAQQRYGAFLTQGASIFEGADSGRAAGLTVTQALDDYWREHCAKNVIAKRRAEVVIGHLKTWFKYTPLCDVDMAASEAYAEARRAGLVAGCGRKGVSAEASDETIRRELSILKAAANHAEKYRRAGPTATPPTPMPVISMPRGEPLAPITDDEWLTRDELRRAIDTAEGHVRDFIIITYDTASRRTAVERLTRFQVDLKNGRVNLRHPTEDANQRRSKKRRPVVPIGPEARAVYERLLAETPNEWLFGKPLDIYRPFRAHMESIGLGNKRNPHMLRHTRATHLLQAGVSLWDVAKLLGDTVQTVERIYGHHCPDHLATVIQRSGA